MSPKANPARWNTLRPKAVRDWSLRGQIVGGVLCLFVILSLAIGLFTEIALKRSLTDRLDGELGKAGQRISPPNSETRPFGAGSIGQIPNGQLYPRIPTSPNQVIGFFTDTEANAIVQREPRTAPADAAGRVPVSAAVITKLRDVAPDAKPHTVELPGLGSYRVLASSYTDASGARETFLNGLPLASVNDTVTNLALVLLGLTLAGLIVAAFLCALLVKLALRPLHRVTTTASRVAEMALDEGEVALAVRVADPNPHTEVGQVGVALNRMLENVSDALNARHRSEMQVRQFVADASHELRTPLASIRGYAELTRRSREIAPPDIAHAMGRVESEAQRMTALVEDLLLLARLDAGRALDEVEVDLTSLTIDVLSDAHIAGPNHRWHLQMPDDPVIVVGDSPRLHQVLGNLLANARTHTPVGTNVYVSVEINTVQSAESNFAVIRVCDDGPGIAPSVIDQIFERFARGEESRSRAAGSTGLGLAIVAAVVAAHHGTITVTSEPGNTVFTVTLPIHRQRQGDAQTAASFATEDSLL